MSTPKTPTLAVLPITKGETSAAGAQILQPAGWPAPKGYANGMAADGRLVVTGGVIGWDNQERLPSDFVAQLPKTGTGKLQRFALRQMAQAGSAAPSSGMAAE